MRLIFKSIIIISIIIIPYCLAEDWSITVYTGRERFAGTDSNVYIRLFNSQGESTSEYQLTHNNWMPEHAFPVRNLFERGARERFEIQTEDIKTVSKIQIRHNNFPWWQADWLLDQVVVERNRDSAKYVFKCNCWLRGERPYVTLSTFPDPRSKDKDKNNNLSSKTKRTFITILLVLIGFVLGIFCCYNKHRRQQRLASLYLADTNEQIQCESSPFDTQPQAPRSSTQSLRPQHWMNILRQWKNERHRSSLESYTPTSQSVAAAAPQSTVEISPVDEPPAYKDLYPNSTNNTLNSNL